MKLCLLKTHDLLVLHEVLLGLDIENNAVRFQNRLEFHASLIVALVVCLFLSWLSAKIGMAAIIGAFFAGMIFADHAVDWDLLPRVHAITEFLGPFFFFSIGAQLNARLFSGDVLVAAIVVTVLAILSKVVGCGLPVMKDGWRTALAVGVGMMPRGEVALIIALVGLSSQIVTQSTYAIVVFMVKKMAASAAR